MAFDHRPMYFIALVGCGACMAGVAASLLDRRMGAWSWVAAGLIVAMSWVGGSSSVQGPEGA